jgi:hypothetical protein
VDIYTRYCKVDYGLRHSKIATCGVEELEPLLTPTWYCNALLNGEIFDCGRETRLGERPVGYRDKPIYQEKVSTEAL